MNNRALYILGLFLVWGFISWYWYTCDIKGFCGSPGAGEEMAVEDDSMVETTEDGDIIIRDTEGNELATCEPYIVDSIRDIWANPPEQVMRLERFLNDVEGEQLAVDGVYGNADFAAVERFQLKYADAILTPYDRTEPTGFVHTETKQKINELHCKAQTAEDEDDEAMEEESEDGEDA